jgi:hypothetical protein
MSDETAKLRVQGYDKDPDKVKFGAPVSFGKNRDGTTRIIWVRPLNSYAYQDRLEALRRPHARAVQRDKDLDRGLQRRAMADTVIPRWEHIQTPEGEEIEFNHANVVAYLEDPDQFFDVVTAAGSVETFLRDQVEDDLGNSPASSSGG